MARLAGLLTAAAAASLAAAGPTVNVHIVPHSHDDAGWLKTVSQYFYGQNQSIYPAGVQYIVDNVVNSLTANPERTFVITEQVFFMMYWRAATPARKAQIKQLVANGQLSFVNGGWVMHDEVRKRASVCGGRVSWWGVARCGSLSGPVHHPHPLSRPHPTSRRRPTPTTCR
jgi:hypothetical protein